MHNHIKKYYPVFLFPALFAFIVSFLIPLIMGLGLSLFKFNVVNDAKFVGFDNYIKVFTDPNSNFLYSLGFTLILAVVAVVSVNIIAFSIALLLTKGLKGTNLFRAIFFAPNLIGGIVLGYVWNTILNAILNNFFNISLLFDAKYGFWSLVLLVNWQMIGYMMVIYIAGLQNIPEDLIEAAAIDGANKRDVLFGITIPMMASAITICTFITMTNAFRIFDQNLALTGGGPAKKTQMLALNIYDTFYGRNGWAGVGQAKAVIFFLLVGAISMIQLNITSSKEMES